MTIFPWNLNHFDNNEALDWEPQFSQDIDVDQVLLDEDVKVFNMHLTPLTNHNRPHRWVQQLNSSRPSMVTLDDPEEELH